MVFSALCLGNLFARYGACRTVTTKLIGEANYKVNYKVKKIVDQMHHHVKLDGIHKLADTNIGLRTLRPLGPPGLP